VQDTPGLIPDDCALPPEETLPRCDKADSPPEEGVAAKRGRPKNAVDKEFLLSLFATALSIRLPEFYFNSKALQHGKTYDKEMEFEAAMKQRWGVQTPKARTLMKTLNQLVGDRGKVGAVTRRKGLPARVALRLTLSLPPFHIA
jgi:hypothetical protein